MNKKILLVEDDPDGQFVLEALLSSLSYSVDLASTVSEAEALVLDPQQAYEMAIIDLSLPDRSGWELLEIIQNIPNPTMCIAVTAYHSSRTREEALQAGFQAYFSKPLNVQAFSRSLEALLE